MFRFYFFALFFTSHLATAQTQGLATVALIANDVHSQEGTLIFTELPPGSTIKVNPFSQYRDTTSENTAKVQWGQYRSRQKLKEGSTLNIGDIIDTGTHGYVRLLLADDSIVDLAPQSLFTIEKFEMTPTARNIKLRLLEGKLRVLVVRKLQGQSIYQVTTPGVLTSVRGTDFIIHTEKTASQIDTHVLGVRGQVTCDLARNTTHGEIYYQTLVVNSTSHLQVRSANGYALSYHLEDDVALAALNTLWDQHAPYTDLNTTALSMHPSPFQLAGTGLPRSQQPLTRAQHTADITEELEAEHPLKETGGIILSGNFTYPEDFKQDPVTIPLQLQVYERFFGPSFVDRPPFDIFKQFSPSLVPIQ